MEWWQEYVNRRYTRKYYDMTDGIEKVLAAFSPVPGSTVSLVVNKELHNVATLPCSPGITRAIDQPAVIRVENTKPAGNFRVSFAWVPYGYPNDSRGQGAALIYGLRFRRFCEYDLASQRYEGGIFEGLPIKNERVTEICEMDPRFPHVKGKLYSPEGWEELKRIVAVIAQELGMDFDPSKEQKGWCR